MDEVVTWADVADGLSPSTRHALEMALSPELRGWYTESEAELDGGRFVETRRMNESRPRLYRTGD